MYVKQGDQISIVESAEFNKELPVGNYMVQQNQMSGQFYLTPVDPFTLPEKIYGNPQYYAERYLNTFHDRRGNLGVLLGGVKGTGKSLLAKMLCMQSNLPVIIITHPYGGAEFKKFLSMIKQECIIFMDEFEKMYASQEAQQSLLSILDGVFEGKKLFLLTANTMKINEFLTNRPGRVYYSREYLGLTQDVINEVIDDLLVNKTHKKDLLRDLMLVGTVNMDMLITIIVEMNRYDESSTASLSFLNIYPDTSMYNVKGRIKTIDTVKNPTVDEDGDVDYDNPDNYITYMANVMDTTFENPLQKLHNFYQDYTYRDAAGELTEDRVYWSKEDMSIEVETDSIKITHSNGDYLVYTPMVRSKKSKVSSDLFVEDAQNERQKHDALQVRRMAKNQKKTKQQLEKLVEHPIKQSEAFCGDSGGA